MRRQEKKQEIRKESRKRRNARRNERRAVQRSFKGFKDMLRKLWNETHPKKKGEKSKETPSSPRKKEDKSYQLPTSKPLQPGSVQGFYKKAPAASCTALQQPISSLLTLAPLSKEEALSSAFQGFLEAAAQRPRRSGLTGFQQLVNSIDGDTGKQPERELFLAGFKGQPTRVFVSKKDMVKAMGTRVPWIRCDVSTGSKPETKQLSSGYVPWCLTAAADGRKWLRVSVALDPKRKEEEAKVPKGSQPRRIYDNGNIDISYPRYFNNLWTTFEEDRKKLLERLVKDCPHVEYAYIADSCATLVIIEKRKGDEPGWLHLIAKSLGVSVVDLKKTVKRLSQLDRPYLMFYKGQKVSFKLIEEVSGVFGGLDAEEIKALLDGAVFISRDLWEATVKQMKELQLKRNDPMSDHMLEVMEKTLQLNGRALLPAGTVLETSSGSEVLQDGAQLKGQFFVNDKLPPGTVSFHRTNLKDEIKVAADQPVRFLCDPQQGHDRSFCTIQYLVAQQHILPHEEVRKWFAENLAKKMELLRRGEYEEDGWLEQLERWGVLKPGYALGVRKKLDEWIRAGGNPFSLPKIALEAVTLGMQALVSLDDWHLSAKIPYSVHWQAISAATAELLGFEDLPTDGITYWNERKLIVVDNVSYLKMLPDHGGSDQDDFFDCILRVVDQGDRKELKAFLLRSPNDMGEYSVHNVQVNSLPKGYRLSQVPVIQGSTALRPWPIRTSDQEELVKAARVNLGKGKQLSGKSYSFESFKEQLYAAKGSAGKLVNTCFAHRAASLASQGWEFTVQDNWIAPFSMENAIDICIQEGDETKIKILEEEAKKLQKLTENYEFFCKVYWEKGQRYGYTPEEQEDIEASGKVIDSELYQLFFECRTLLDQALTEIKEIFKTEGAKYKIRAFCTGAEEFEQEPKKKRGQVWNVIRPWHTERAKVPEHMVRRIWEEELAAKCLEKASDKNFLFKLVYLTQYDPDLKKVNESTGKSGEEVDGWKYSFLLLDAPWKALMKVCQEKSLFKDFFKTETTGVRLSQKKVPQESVQEEEPMKKVCNCKNRKSTKRSEQEVYCGRNYGGYENQGFGNECSKPDQPCPICKQIHIRKGDKSGAGASVQCFEKLIKAKIEAKDPKILKLLEDLRSGAVKSLLCWCKDAQEPETEASKMTCHTEVLWKLSQTKVPQEKPQEVTEGVIKFNSQSQGPEKVLAVFRSPEEFKTWKIQTVKDFINSSEEIKAFLLETGDKRLEYNCLNEFWGTAKGSGKNVLGKVLMGFRSYLKLINSHPITVS